MNFRDFRQILNEFKNQKMVFVGLGSSQCGDDDAGRILLNRLTRRAELKGAEFLDAGTNPENYLGKITAQKPEAVIFIDTARFGAPPGTIKLLDEKQLNPTDFSTHTFSIAMIAEYIARQNPCRFYYLGIQPENTTIGKPVSEVLKNAIAVFFQ